MIGPYINGAALFLGCLTGGVIGPKLNKNLRVQIPMVFGCASLGIGIVMTTKIKFFAPVVLALILGTIIGELAQVETNIQKWVSHTKRWLEKITKPSGDISQEEFLDKFVALMVLFCVSGMGVYGSLSEGMTGDPTILVVKAILDLFTGLIFASTMGYTLALLVIPQLSVQAVLYYGASLIVPLTTPDMMADFSACGGIIMLATGFRICGIKQFPVAGMIPSLLLVMPLSWAWATYMPAL